MRLLLDTHALLWALSAPQQLPVSLRRAIQAVENDVYASLASAWEIALKAALGKIEFDVRSLERMLAATGFQTLDISLQHAARVAELPLHHGDPFDRMLVAQALSESMVLVTRDRALRQYGVRILWQRPVNP